jgi:hypothetical protein
MRPFSSYVTHFYCLFKSILHYITLWSNYLFFEVGIALFTFRIGKLLYSSHYNTAVLYPEHGGHYFLRRVYSTVQVYILSRLLKFE